MTTIGNDTVYGPGPVREALEHLACQIGPGVSDLSFTLSVEGGVITLSPANLEMAVTEHDNGTTLFTGRWRDITVEWEFTECQAGLRVQLRASGSSSLRCNHIDSLILRYRPTCCSRSIFDWRLLGAGPESGLIKVSDLEELKKENWGSDGQRMIYGVFPDREGEGLFIGNMLPQRFVHTHKVHSSDSDSLVFVSTTKYPEGPSLQNTLTSESIWVCGTKNAKEALETCASFMPEMPAKELVVGWNSWDYYFSTVSLNDLIENMDEIRKDTVLSEKVKYIVVDAGWEAKEGEWFPNYKFPGGLERLADEIRLRGFIPGIWTAPLVVQYSSTIALRSPEILIKDEYGDPLPLAGGHYLVDVTHPAGKEYLSEVYTRLYRCGFRFFKVDFVLYLVESPRFHDGSKGPYEALTDLFGLIRGCVTDESHILGCFLPAECGAGVADSGRTGIDIHNQWSHATWAFDGFMLHYWMHNRIWVNDPDFLVVRGRDTSLEVETNVMNPTANNPNPPRWRRGPVFTYDEARTWASIVLMSGGSIFLSDRISMLNELGIGLLRKAVQPTGVSAEPLDLCDDERPSLWLQVLESEKRLTIINWSDTPSEYCVDFDEYELKSPSQVIDFWTGQEYTLHDGILRIDLPPHACCLAQWSDS